MVLRAPPAERQPQELRLNMNPSLILIRIREEIAGWGRAFSVLGVRRARFGSHSVPRGVPEIDPDQSVWGNIWATWMNLQGLRPIQGVVLVITCVVLLVGPTWWFLRVQQRKELRALYYSARSGDLESLSRLAEHHSSEASLWLAKLAQDRHTDAELRVEALSKLAARRSVDETTVAPLLWIDQPFVVRHAAVDLFMERGCYDACISATLRSFGAMWDGQTTAEFNARSPETSEDNVILAQIRTDSERDYMNLLNRNPCATQRMLADEHASASDFVKRVRAGLKTC